MRIWVLDKYKLLHILNKWIDSWLMSTRDIGQMNVCVDKMERKEVQLRSLAGACKVRTSSKDWVWFV